MITRIALPWVLSNGDWYIIFWKGPVISTLKGPSRNLIPWLYRFRHLITEDVPSGIKVGAMRGEHSWALGLGVGDDDAQKALMGVGDANSREYMLGVGDANSREYMLGVGAIDPMANMLLGVGDDVIGADPFHTLLALKEYLNAKKASAGVNPPNGAPNPLLWAVNQGGDAQNLENALLAGYDAAKKQGYHMSGKLNALVHAYHMALDPLTKKGGRGFFGEIAHGLHEVVSNSVGKMIHSLINSPIGKLISAIPIVGTVINVADSAYEAAGMADNAIQGAKAKLEEMAHSLSPSIAAEGKRKLLELTAAHSVVKIAKDPAKMSELKAALAKGDKKAGAVLIGIAHYKATLLRKGARNLASGIAAGHPDALATEKTMMAKAKAGSPQAKFAALTLHQAKLYVSAHPWKLPPMYRAPSAASVDEYEEGTEPGESDDYEEGGDDDSDTIVGAFRSMRRFRIGKRGGGHRNLAFHHALANGRITRLDPKILKNLRDARLKQNGAAAPSPDASPADASSDDGGGGGGGGGQESSPDPEAQADAPPPAEAFAEEQGVEEDEDPEGEDPEGVEEVGNGSPHKLHLSPEQIRKIKLLQSIRKNGLPKLHSMPKNKLRRLRLSPALVKELLGQIRRKHRIQPRAA